MSRRTTVGSTTMASGQPGRPPASEPRGEPPRSGECAARPGQDDLGMAESAGVPRTAAAPCCNASPPTRRVHAMVAPDRRPGRPAVLSGVTVPTSLALSAGQFVMGSSEPGYPADGEGPPRTVDVAAFRIAAHAVSKDDFATFVAATGYLTTAEREGWSFVFAGLLPDHFPPTRAVAAAPWWRQVPAAAWHRPEGRGSDLDGRWFTCPGWTPGPTAGGPAGGCPARTATPAPLRSMPSRRTATASTTRRATCGNGA